MDLQYYWSSYILRELFPIFQMISSLFCKSGLSCMLVAEEPFLYQMIHLLQIRYNKPSHQETTPPHNLAYVIATLMSFTHEKLLVVFHTAADSVSLQAEYSYVNVSKTLLGLGFLGFKCHQGTHLPVLIDGVGLQTEEQTPLCRLYTEGAEKIIGSKLNWRLKVNSK